MTKIWSAEKANTWYQNIDPIRGCNYLPRTAINTTELWQASTFDPETIDQELGWAAAAGYNSVRIFVQYLVWQDDPDGLKQRMDQLLSIASRHHIRAMFTLFDDCAFAGKEPFLGPQDDPVPGVHNSGWTPSPGLKRVTDKAIWPSLEQYIKDIVGTFRNDQRVLVWDLYNEPGNSNLGEKSLPLVEASFAWAREANPEQPLTISAWQDGPTFDGLMSQTMFALSDVISFHYYERAGMEEAVQQCQSFGRPVINTEWLHRPKGNTIAEILPIFSREQVGWYHWGLVAGRTQTYLDWTSKAGDPLPEIWQHDIFHADGTPYNPHEIALLKDFSFW